jgi:hypothetical protein
LFLFGELDRKRAPPRHGTSSLDEDALIIPSRVGTKYVTVFRKLST